MMQSFLHILIISILQLVYLFGTLIGIGLLLGILENRSNTYLQKAFGWKGVLLTAWIGTPIHEMGHAIMCLLFKHKIIKIKLFQWNDPNGVLGYVEHAYNLKSIYQRAGLFFIGLAPLFSGILALIAIMHLMLPQSYLDFKTFVVTKIHPGPVDNTLFKSMFLSIGGIFQSLFTLQNLLNPLFWLFIFFAISISSHIALSKADMKESLNGLMMLFGLLLLFNTIAGLLNINSMDLVMTIGLYNSYVLGFSSIAVFFSFISLAVSYILYRVKVTMHSK